MEGEKQEGEAERKEEGKAVGMSSIISGGKSECCLNFVWILNHPCQSAVSPQEVQTAGAGFKEYWPGLLENVVWIQCPCVLKLINGTNG